FDPNRVPPPAIGDPFGYVIPYEGVQNVLYRGNDRSLHGLWWLGIEGDVHNDFVTTSSISDAIGYVAVTQRQQNAIHIGGPGGRGVRTLYRLFWSTGAATSENLTRASHIGRPVGQPTGNFNEIDGLHHVFFRSLGAIPRYSAVGNKVHVLW